MFECVFVSGKERKKERNSICYEKKAIKLKLLLKASSSLEMKRKKKRGKKYSYEIRIIRIMIVRRDVIALNHFERAFISDHSYRVLFELSKMSSHIIN